MCCNFQSPVDNFSRVYGNKSTVFIHLFTILRNIRKVYCPHSHTKKKAALQSQFHTMSTKKRKCTSEWQFDKAMTNNKNWKEHSANIRNAKPANHSLTIMKTTISDWHGFIGSKCDINSKIPNMVWLLPIQGICCVILVHNKIHAASRLKMVLKHALDLFALKASLALFICIFVQKQQQQSCTFKR